MRFFFRRFRTKPAAVPASSGDTYARMHKAIRALDRGYRLKPSSCDVSPVGVTLVFTTRADRERAERDGTTARIADDLRANAIAQGLDPATSLQMIIFADTDAIEAAGGEYYFFK